MDAQVMEIMSNPVVMIILGIFTTVITQLAKRFNWDHKYVVVITAVFIGSLYTLYSNVFTVEAQKFVGDIIMQVIGTSTLLYNIYSAFGKSKK